MEGGGLEEAAGGEFDAKRSGPGSDDASLILVVR